MVLVRILLPVAVAAILLGGCSAESAEVAVTSATGDAPATSPPASPEQPSPAGPTDGQTEGPSFPECSAADQEGIAATVAGQLAAFAAGDFRAALELASASFRSTVTLRGFRRIIREGYPEVASASSHRVIECREVAPGQVQALVSVTGETGTVARIGYRCVLEPEGWRVDGASVLERARPQAA